MGPTAIGDLPLGALSTSRHVGHNGLELDIAIKSCIQAFEATNEVEHENDVGIDRDRRILSSRSWSMNEI
jgi:hypothetical protein